MRSMHDFLLEEAQPWSPSGECAPWEAGTTDRSIDRFDLNLQGNTFSYAIAISLSQDTVLDSITRKELMA